MFLIPWKHNIILMQKIKDQKVRRWYIEKIIKKGWVESVILYQLDIDLTNKREIIEERNFIYKYYRIYTFI